jgi:hypothetical protein
MPQAFNAAWIFWPSAELPPKPPPAPDGLENDGREPDGNVPDGRVRDPLGNPPARPLGTVIPAAFRQACTLALPNTPPPKPRLAVAEADADADAEAGAEPDDEGVDPELPLEHAASPAVPRVKVSPTTVARIGRFMRFFLCS